MKTSSHLLRQAHFLGTKIRNLRKRNHLTMDDLSARCVQIDPDAAPSVSYLSMIENGKRVPKIATLELIAEVFQKDIDWFLDEMPDEEAIVPIKRSGGGIKGISLEPGFLFSKEHLQIAIPEMLSQTGITGRQFAQLLIRAHQEHHQNHFPDLERAAEDVGLKRMPLSLDDVFGICKHMGLKLKWFSRDPERVVDDTGIKRNTLIRSFFEPPGVIYINQSLKDQPTRLKYDLATHIAHCVLHNKDGMRNAIAAGDGLRGNPTEERMDASHSLAVNSQDILHAWRDFECSFFAGALLCPKGPFRQHLNHHAYSVDSGRQLDVSTSLLMRRMTAVSPYPHWHYFDAYQPGRLRAVYRGNGIPLPWGNMTMVPDPCHHWSVFRMLGSRSLQPSAQISVLNNGEEDRLYSCESLRVKDAAGNYHVLCAGVDLNPAIESQGKDPAAIIEQIANGKMADDGGRVINKAAKQDLLSVARILNISWVERGIDNSASVICPRSSACPRDPVCPGTSAKKLKKSSMTDVREEIKAGKISSISI